MQNLSYGYQQPDNGDLAVNPAGTGWYAQWVYNIVRLNAHNHDGANSALLNVSNLAGYTVVAAAADWISTGTSGYYQILNAPVGVGDVNDYNVKFYISTAGADFGKELYLTSQRQGTGNQIKIYCATNTVAVTCLFR